MDTSESLHVPNDVNDPIFIEQDDNGIMLLSDDDYNDDEYQGHQNRPNSLINRSSVNVKLRPSELLDDIHNDELVKVKDELVMTKEELQKERESTMVMIKRMKSQSEAVGKVKEHKHGRTLSKIQTEYNDELADVNKKLMITQNLHIKELDKLKKMDITHKLELKLKNKKIEELTAENAQIIASKERMQNDHDAFLEKMREKFEVDMEEEVEKRTSQYNEENQKLMDELRNVRNSTMMDDEVDLGKDTNEITAGLRADIRRLEKNNEKDHNMFYKHTQIFEHKLERELKTKKELEEKVKSLQRLREEETDEMNGEILSLSQELSQQKEANVVLQEHFEMVSDQNIRLKKIEEDYNVVARHIDDDYTGMNQLMEELQAKSKQKEQELEQIKAKITQKEMENSKLQTHYVQSSQTIQELQEQLDRDADKTFEAEKLSYRQELSANNAKEEEIERMKEELKEINARSTKTNMLFEEKDQVIERMKKELKDIYAHSTKAKKELDEQKRLVEETKKSKVKLVDSFATEMNRIRGEIKKQNKSRNSIIRSS